MHHLSFHKNHILTLILSLCASLQSFAIDDYAAGIIDVTPVLSDSISMPDTTRCDWKELLKQRRLNVMNTSVKYPDFIEFCLDIYRWAELTFNTYDQEYVTGTGKHGKVRLMSDNWLNSYAFHLSDTPALIMQGNMYSNIGIQANYSILSISLSNDVNSLFHKSISSHKKMGFSFTCARLFVDAYYWNDRGDTYVRRFGDMNYTHRERELFHGMNFRAYGVSGLYFFNHRKFSYGAAYNLSTYQRKSAGSPIVGAMGTFYNADIDFTQLPPSVASENPYPYNSYHFDYNSVTILGGYTYNWVCNKHFLFNITATPGLGVTFSHKNSTSGSQRLLALAGKSGLSLSYTNRQFFASITANFHGNMFLTKETHFATGILNFQISSGVRF